MAPYGLARHNRNQMITPYRGGKCISGYWDIGDATNVIKLSRKPLNMLLFHP